MITYLEVFGINTEICIEKIFHLIKYKEKIIFSIGKVDYQYGGFQGLPYREIRKMYVLPAYWEPLYILNFIPPCSHPLSRFVIQRSRQYSRAA